MDISNNIVKISREKLINHYKRRDSLSELLYALVRFIGILVQNIYCIYSYLVLSWIILLPIKWVRNDIYSRLENSLYNYLLFIVSSWSLAAGATVVETGDEYKFLIEKPDRNTRFDESANGHERGPRSIASNQVATTTTYNSRIVPAKGDVIQSRFISRDTSPRTRILLLCNHISTADVPLIMQSFSTLSKQSLLWVLDAQFKPTNFGLVCSSHGDFFIAKDSFSEGSLKNQVLKYPDRNLLVLFPEGGFLRKRLDGSNRYALRNGLPMTKYVTHPRFGAFKDLVDPSVGVTHIVDATLMYDDIKNPLSILDITLGTRKEPAILHFKVYDCRDINPTEEWLRQLWIDKDKLLQQYYEDRDIIYRKLDGTMRWAKLNWLKVLSVHLFYSLVCYLTTCYTPLGVWIC